MTGLSSLASSTHRGPESSLGVRVAHTEQGTCSGVLAGASVCVHCQQEISVQVSLSLSQCSAWDFGVVLFWGSPWQFLDLFLVLERCSPLVEDLPHRRPE